MSEVLYFGYGANRSADMMKAIIGRKPQGFHAVLRGYELCVQRWEDVPENVREILSHHWTPDFRSYCIRPGKGEVLGNVWSLTELERELFDEWKIYDLWYQPINVHVKRYDGKEVEVESDMVDNPNLQIVNDLHYRTFLNDKRKMLEVAVQTREEFLRKTKR